MRVLFFANRMPDMCGAFLHDIDLATELQKRGHSIVFLIIQRPRQGYNGDIYRGFRFLHYTAATNFLESSDIWICPHSPILPDVRKINSRGYFRPIIATCHFDGNYTAISGNADTRWSEMLMFVNKIMQQNYFDKIKPWPSSIVRTETVRPILHRNQITITEPFRGEYITLVNANLNKGVLQFLQMAKSMPTRKFLGVLPYYGELRVPPAPSNVKWVSFDDDVRNILKQTRILLVPSYYESYGRIAVEAMLNGIPVLYSKPCENPPFPHYTTEGMQEWIGDAAIACDREKIEEWVASIEFLDDPEKYAQISQMSKDHIESMDLFTEATRIAKIVEDFSRSNPAKMMNSMAVVSAPPAQAVVSPVPSQRISQPVGRVGFSNGRLRIQR
jgi:glycosyltransferase involved in cell wall biosynthesis